MPGGGAFSVFRGLRFRFSAVFFFFFVFVFLLFLSFFVFLISTSVYRAVETVNCCGAGDCGEVHNTVRKTDMEKSLRADRQAHI